MNLELCTGSFHLQLLYQIHTQTRRDLFVFPRPPEQRRCPGPLWETFSRQGSEAPTWQGCIVTNIFVWTLHNTTSFSKFTFPSHPRRHPSCLFKRHLIHLFMQKRYLILCEEKVSTGGFRPNFSTCQNFSPKCVEYEGQSGWRHSINNFDCDHLTLAGGHQGGGLHGSPGGGRELLLLQQPHLRAHPGRGRGQGPEEECQVGEGEAELHVSS